MFLAAVVGGTSGDMFRVRYGGQPISADDSLSWIQILSSATGLFRGTTGRGESFLGESDSSVLVYYMTCNGDNGSLTVSYIMLTRLRILSNSYVRRLYLVSSWGVLRVGGFSSPV